MRTFSSYMPRDRRPSQQQQTRCRGEQIDSHSQVGHVSFMPRQPLVSPQVDVNRPCLKLLGQFAGKPNLSPTRYIHPASYSQLFSYVHDHLALPPEDPRRTTMTSSGDRYARDASGFSSPDANITQSHARQAPQPQRQTPAPQDVMLHQHLLQTQHSGTAYYPYQSRSYQQTASSQGALGYTYAPTNQPAYQGSRITPGSNDTPGDQYQVNLPGAQHSLDDPRQRTTDFVNGQQIRTESSPDEAEQNGIRRGTNTISQFDNQFTRTVDTSTSANNAQRDERYPQYNRQSYLGYPRTLDYCGQNDSSSHPQR
ncbi:hypothetical protein Forpi1262_v007784 [Fusarium oxysporum f. sp. raphani]|uniref:Uncharacterized protein n=1 Tax=Fusarium oxysporum f. sp. raphani TaxID=96318 RepID=A0A8J5PPT7_FUSOX|nr:hypothetical protein Forpi1262_v007784 [Fusarium oxysporum f. sp. raphani]